MSCQEGTKFRAKPENLTGAKWPGYHETPMAEPDEGCVYQFKVVLRGVSRPPLPVSSSTA